MKVLVLGSHCDDIELGCGATLFKHRFDWNITSATFTTNLEEYSRKALPSLGVGDMRYYYFDTNHFAKRRQEVWEILHELDLELSPDLVITQSPDEHQDHVVIFQETIRNFRRSSILAYRSSIRNCSNFEHLVFECLSPEDVEAKLESLQYYSPIYSDKIYFKPENVTAMLRVQGIYVESEFAETFDVIKMIGI